MMGVKNEGLNNNLRLKRIVCGLPHTGLVSIFLLVGPKLNEIQHQPNMRAVEKLSQESGLKCFPSTEPSKNTPLDWLAVPLLFDHNFAVAPPVNTLSLTSYEQFFVCSKIVMFPSSGVKGLKRTLETKPGNSRIQAFCCHLQQYWKPSWFCKGLTGVIFVAIVVTKVALKSKFVLLALKTCPCGVVSCGDFDHNLFQS